MAVGSVAVVGMGKGPGVGVAVGRITGVGRLMMSVGRGVLVGGGVAVGIRVLIGVGAAGVGVTPLAVGIKFGKVGVAVGGTMAVDVDVEDLSRVSRGKSKMTARPKKTRTTNPTKMLITAACERVNNILLSP